MPTTHLTSEEICARLKEAAERNTAAVAVIPREDRNYWLMLVQQRDTTGKPEMHACEADIYIPVEGNAQLTLDGELAAAQETSPGQFIGSRIVGGRTIALRAGDVVHIPPGVPHQLKTGPTRFKQFVVKVAVV